MRVPSCLLLLALTTSPAAQAASPGQREVLEAMKKATDFMVTQVSNRGGFVWHYTGDLSRQWGEIPARSTQIWVQSPGTPDAGLMFLEAWRITGEPRYLEEAGRAAGALIWGQHPAGGWHYFVDFDPAGVDQFYEEVASQCRGWEEFYYNYGNATFDDDTTAGATRFLLRLYHATLDPKWRGPLLKALAFILEAQYPNGAWPQRYPLKENHPKDGRPDYTSFYTYNDEVISGNIYLLWEAWEKLGDEAYRKAARRGMDFYLISQLPDPQGGWAQQYDHEMRPGWARTYEPAAVCSSQTVDNIQDLQNFYRLTRERRYLEPIPKALRWLRASVLNSDPGSRYTHATYYEVGTNKPLYARHVVRDGKIDHYVVTYDRFDLPYYGGVRRIDVEALQREFDRVRNLDAGAALAEYQHSWPLRPAAAAKPQEAAQWIAQLDHRGAWITDIEFLDIDNYADNPPLRFRGIDTRTYIRRMYQLLSYLEDLRVGAGERE